MRIISIRVRCPLSRSEMVATHLEDTRLRFAQCVTHEMRIDGDDWADGRTSIRSPIRRIEGIQIHLSLRGTKELNGIGRQRLDVDDIEDGAGHGRVAGK
jgi:hypothetical protein